MKVFSRTLALMAVLFFAASVTHADEVVLIVNPDNSLTDISLKDVKKIYLGKSKFFSSGEKVIPVDQAEKSKVKEIFYEVIVGKSKSQLQKYWSKRIFTGRGTPPKALKDDAAVIEWVAEHPQGLGYVFKGSVNDSVKVLKLK